MSWNLPPGVTQQHLDEAHQGIDPGEIVCERCGYVWSAELDDDEYLAEADCPRCQDRQDAADLAMDFDREDRV